MITKYPADCIQHYVESWWIETEGRALCRGRLVRAFLAHVDQVPYTLVPESRTEPSEHRSANYRIEPLRIGRPPHRPQLPIAALPLYEGEVLVVQRAKSRPALVVSAGGEDVPAELRGGSYPRWQTAPTILVAPSYSAEADDKLKWNPKLVRRLRRCEFPQYLWDRVPLLGADESIIRLDHIQPIGRHHDSLELTNYCLSPEALRVLDEWLTWLLTGLMEQSGVLYDVRRELMTAFELSDE